MNLWKLSALMTFGVFTCLCVTYAHSAEVETLNFKSSSWLGGCRLTVEKSAGGVAVYIPASESRTRFEGYWPTVPGEVYMAKNPRKGQQELLIGVEIPPEETLVVSFRNLNGRITPVGYVFDPVNKRLATKGMIQDKTCVSLKKVD